MTVLDRSEVELVRSTFGQGLAGIEPASMLTTLEELGFAELFESHPMVAVSELFETMGRLLAAGPSLDLVVSQALSVELPHNTAWLHADPRSGKTVAATLGTDGTLRISGVVLGGRARSDALIAAADTNTGVGLFSVAAGTDGLEWRDVKAIDADARLQHIEGTVRGAGVEAAKPITEQAWAGAVGAARRAVGHELVGVGSQMLAMAVEHVKDRHQFGRPIGAFQSVRHRLADVHVALTAARNLLAGAWDEPDLMLCDVAKAQAGRAALLANQHCQQVCGAIGYTWEHGLHRYIRRALLLDSIYGRSSELVVSLGRQVKAVGRAPRFHPLHHIAP